MAAAIRRPNLKAIGGAVMPPGGDTIHATLPPIILGTWMLRYSAHRPRKDRQARLPSRANVDNLSPFSRLNCQRLERPNPLNRGLAQPRIGPFTCQVRHLDFPRGRSGTTPLVKKLASSLVV